MIFNESLMAPEKVSLEEAQMQAQHLDTSGAVALSCHQYYCPRLKLTHQGGSKLF